MEKRKTGEKGGREKYTKCDKWKKIALYYMHALQLNVFK